MDLSFLIFLCSSTHLFNFFNLADQQFRYEFISTQYVCKIISTIHVWVCHIPLAPKKPPSKPMGTASTAAAASTTSEAKARRWFRHHAWLHSHVSTTTASQWLPTSWCGLTTSSFLRPISCPLPPAPSPSSSDPSASNYPHPSIRQDDLLLFYSFFSFPSYPSTFLPTTTSFHILVPLFRLLLPILRRANIHTDTLISSGDITGLSN